MNKSSLINLLAFTLLFTFAGCSNHKEELKHLSALSNTLEANRENFDLDMPLFESRKEFIESTLTTFKKDYKDTISLELGNSLSRYKAIKKIYSKNINEFEKNQRDQEELENQLKNLEIDLKNNKLTKEAFKAYYSTEKTEILALIESSKNVKSTLYQVEPDYIRITEELTPILEKLQD